MTGRETTFEALASRIRAAPDAELHEARLDLLAESPPGLVARLPALDRLVVTVRSEREGGGWRGDEESRVARLLEAVAAGAAYVDVEASTPDPLLRRVLEAGGGTRKVVSAHLPAGSTETPRAAMERLAALPGDVLKLALPVDDAAELGSLREASEGIRRDHVVIGMGAAGELSRVAFRRFGSLWTYVTADAASATAPGQWTIDQARRIGLGRQSPEVFGLLGGDSALRSPGPRVYGQLLPRSGRALAYVPLPTRRPAAVVAMARSGLVAGFSVTMPHKVAVRDLIDEEAPSARHCRSVNTIELREGRLVGHSTDGEGAVAALGGLDALAGRRILVLGSGGAAASIVRSAADAGALIAVAGRTSGRALALATATGTEVVPWEAIARTPFDILVNTTPVGSDGMSIPIADPSVMAGRIVLDMVIDPMRTPLLDAAERAGAAAAIPGVVVWAFQGAAQMHILTGLSLEPEELLRAAIR